MDGGGENAVATKNQTQNLEGLSEAEVRLYFTLSGWMRPFLLWHKTILPQNFI